MVSKYDWQMCFAHLSPVSVSVLISCRETHCKTTQHLLSYISSVWCVFMWLWVCVLLPLKSLCSRCLQSEGSWVATFRSRHTADSETRETTSSSRNTRSSSSGGRTARPNRAGRPSAAHTNSRQTLWMDTPY